MSGILSVAIFTTVGKIAHRHIKTWIAAGTADSGYGMTFLTIFKIGFCFRPMQSSACKRKRMRRAGTAGMTTRDGTVGIGESGCEAARCRRIGSGSTLGKIVTNITSRVLIQRIAVAGQVVDGNIVGTLPTGGMSPCVLVALIR